MIRSKLAAAILSLLGVAHAAEPQPAFELALVDLRGGKQVLGTLPGSVFSPRLSPDGERVAFELSDGPPAPNQVLQLHVARLDALEDRRALPLTVIAQRNLAPVWSPNGEWIAFMASGNAADTLFWQRADGSIQPIYLLDGRAPEGLYEGDKLAFITLTGNRDYGIALFDIATKQVTTLVDLPGSEQHSSRISPDGKWLAYASNETGRQEVWLEPLPQTGQRFQLTREGGRHPLWSPDGRTLYFDQGGRMYSMAVTLEAGAASAAAPVALPITGFQQGDLRRQFDLTPDGQAFLMLFPLRSAQ